MIYENHRIDVQLQKAPDPSLNIDVFGFPMRPGVDLRLPVICMVTFAAVSVLGYRYLRHRPQAVLLLWALVWIIAVMAGYIVTTVSGDFSGLLVVGLFSGISYLVYWLWKRHAHSVLLFWQVIGISAVLTLAAGTQLIGLFRVQRWELSRPWLWLFCLLVVLLVNLVFGTVLHLIFSRYARNKAENHY